MAKRVGMNIDELSNKELSIFFLGVGIAVFVLNTLSFLSLWPYLKLSQLGLFGPFFGHYMSYASSLFLIVYSIVEIHRK